MWRWTSLSLALVCFFWLSLQRLLPTGIPLETGGGECNSTEKIFLCQPSDKVGIVTTPWALKAV